MNTRSALRLQPFQCRPEALKISLLRRGTAVDLPAVTSSVQNRASSCVRRPRIAPAGGDIQPENVASIALVRRLGFQREGYSPRYLRINGEWRDHERWALLADSPRPAC